jgi:hypothetical protein
MALCSFIAFGSKKRTAQMNAPSMAIEKSVSKFIGLTFRDTDMRRSADP